MIFQTVGYTFTLCGELLLSGTFTTLVIHTDRTILSLKHEQTLLPSSCHLGLYSSGNLAQSKMV